MVINKKKVFAGQLVLCFFLLLLSLTMFLPFIYILCVSFTDASAYQASQISFWPKKWSTLAYQYVLSGHGFKNSLASTLFLTVVGTPISIIFNAGLAYMLSRRELPGKKVILKLVVFTMLFSPGMIPHYLVIMHLNLLNSLWSIILPGATGAWTVLVMKSFFQNLPPELDEAATIDGCNEVQIFFRIDLPLSKAMLATFTLFNAVSFWNTYFNAVLYLNDSDKWPLQVFLQQIVQSANTTEFLDMGMTNANVLPPEIIKMATIIIAVLPIMMVYPFLQKYFAKGVMIGSVKG